MKRQYASFSQRMLAHNIDLVILLPFFYLIGYFEANNFRLAALCFIVYVLFHSIFELTKWRGTPGKRLQKIEVVQSKGERPSVLMIFLRNALKLFSAIIIFYGFLMINWDQKRQGLHDRITGCVVIFFGRN